METIRERTAKAMDSQRDKDIHDFPQQSPQSPPAQNADADNKVHRTSVPQYETTINVSTDIQENTVLADLEKDGVRLAELLLTWTRTQEHGTAVLKEALRNSNSGLKRLQDRFIRLRGNEARD